VDLFKGLNSSKTGILHLEQLRQSLIDWYHRHKRLLPWRETRDPYRIWLSEIILQQTRVEQGRPYYQRFVNEFPTVEALAHAPQERVLKLWEGLGYYSRARNLHEAAKTVTDKGAFPKTYQDLLELKGVGDYTASAVASFAYDEAKAVVDGNVFRVLSRLYGDATPINTGAGKKRFKALADALLNPDDPATHNQAVMELGALQCLPKAPKCEDCPWKQQCIAHVEDKVNEFPVKRRKQYNRERFLNYLMIHDGEDLYLQKRAEGIWKGLFQFPLFESAEKLDPKSVLEQQNIYLGELKLDSFHELPAHKLSHQTLYITILVLTTPGSLPASATYLKYSHAALHALAMPRPLRKFLEQKQLTLPF
jgi:A/G-specific adenine glycosylase